MSSALWLAALCVVFVACRWSGRLLDHHYADRAELSAVMLVGLCVVGSFLLGADTATVWGLPVRWLLGIAMTGGLLVGRRAQPA
jgi:hypothetical protein